jgi:F-type H+-transporting ATPase subunit b
MIRYLSILLLLLVALPAMAEQTLSPIEVESIPFSGTSSDVSPNTNALYVEEHMVEAYGEKKDAGLPQFDTTTFSSQLFWLAITFIVMYFALAKIILPRLSKVMEDRQMTIKSDLEKADQLSNDVEKTRQAYEDELEKAHLEARATSAKIEEDLRDKSMADSNAFKEKADKQINDLEARAELAKDKIKDDLTDIAENLTADVVEKLSFLKIKEVMIAETVKGKINGDATPAPKKKAA